MGDRVIIVTQHPGKIDQTLRIDLNRPRDRSSSDFLRLRSDISELLHFAGAPSIAKAYYAFLRNRILRGRHNGLAEQPLSINLSVLCSRRGVTTRPLRVPYKAATSRHNVAIGLIASL